MKLFENWRIVLNLFIDKNNQAMYKMKKLLFLPFLFLSLIANATHNITGNITYTYISGTTYKITVRTFTNTVNTQADRCEMTVHFGDGDSVPMPRTNGNSVNCISPQRDGIQICPNAKMNIYEGTHTYPGNGTYTITVEDPNLNAGICNIPNSVNASFGLIAELVINPFLGSNISVVYNGFGFIANQVGVSSTYNPQLSNTDGDSLYCQLISPFANGAPIAGYTLPPASVSLAIDNATGIIVWNAPNQVCEYLMVIKVSEYRNVGGTYYYIGSTIQDVTTNPSCPSLLAVGDYTLTSDITIYPNPTTNQFQVSSTRHKVVAVSIYNVLGELVMSKVESQKSKELVIDVSALMKGGYILEVTTENGVVRKKLIKE
jgi:Secretion system C-terminal sorting domain